MPLWSLGAGVLVAPFLGDGALGAFLGLTFGDDLGLAFVGESLGDDFGLAAFSGDAVPLFSAAAEPKLAVSRSESSAFFPVESRPRALSSSFKSATFIP